VKWHLEEKTKLTCTPGGGRKWFEKENECLGLLYIFIDHRETFDSLNGLIINMPIKNNSIVDKIVSLIAMIKSNAFA
jgi:hypothetical protein